MKPSILIVDDDEMMQETLSSVLKKGGYEIFSVTSGNEALSLIKKNIIDLVLLDMKLPDVDGLEIQKKIKTFDTEILVIIMTAYSDVQTAVSAMKSGAYHYINKPFELEELKLLIEKGLETLRGRLGAAVGPLVVAAVLAMAIFLPRRLSAGLALVAAALALGWGLARAGLLPASLTARLADAADFTTVADVRGVNINDANFAIVERLAHWQAAAAMARAAPWLGVGLGNYSAAYPAFRLLNWPNALGHAHMIYLNVLAETGVLGLITYVILWGTIIGLTMRVTSRADGASRGLALGLLGTWAHLSAHHIVDNLYVNNIHLLLAALFALLVHISHQPRDSVFE